MVTYSFDESFPKSTNQNHQYHTSPIGYPNETNQSTKNKRKVGGSDKWYEQITLNYNTSFKNSVTTFDSILFEKEILDKLQYGVKHSLSSDVSFKLLKYFNLSPSVRYDEEWFFGHRS